MALQILADAELPSADVWARIQRDLDAMDAMHRRPVGQEPPEKERRNEMPGPTAVAAWLAKVTEPGVHLSPGGEIRCEITALRGAMEIALSPAPGDPMSLLVIFPSGTSVLSRVGRDGRAVVCADETAFTLAADEEARVRVAAMFSRAAGQRDPTRVTGSLTIGPGIRVTSGEKGVRLTWDEPKPGYLIDAGGILFPPAIESEIRLTSCFDATRACPDPLLASEVEPGLLGRCAAGSADAATVDAWRWLAETGRLPDLHRRAILDGLRKVQEDDRAQ